VAPLGATVARAGAIGCVPCCGGGGRKVGAAPGRGGWWPAGAARGGGAGEAPPAAPVLFSTMTGWPRLFARDLLNSRAMISVTPPTSNPTTTVIVRLCQGGGAWPRTALCPSTTNSAAPQSNLTAQLAFIESRSGNQCF